jgi:CheY-like chemotaxis protein
MNRILVVEDESLTQDMLRRFFEIVGYEVIRAVNGTEAVKQAQEGNPHLIILDINLPDFDGYEVCRRLRGDDKTRRIPIIFLTTKDDRRDKLAGLELGADDFLTKPFDIEELRLRVHNIIQRMGGTLLVDPRTSLPSSGATTKRLPRLLEHDNSVFLDVEIEHIDVFSGRYGPVAANQAIRSSAKIIGDLLHEIDPVHSFIGHPSDHRFLIGLPDDAGVSRVEKELPERFKAMSSKFYDKSELEREKMVLNGKESPLMGLSLKRITPQAVKSELGTVEVKPGPEAKPAGEVKKEPEVKADPKLPEKP